MRQAPSLYAPLIAASVVIALSAFALQPAAALTPQARPYYMQAIQAERHGHLEDAENALRKAMSLDPQDYLNYVKLGSILSQEGKPREALSYYQKALELFPADSMILFSIGNVYEQLGEYQKATEAYTLTLQNNPRYAYALLNLARSEIQQREYPSAIGHYKQFLDRYPEHFEARRRLAKLYLVTSQPQLAVVEYQALKSRFGEKFTDHLDLAKALNGANDPQAALQELNEAYAAEGGKGDIVEEMGRAHVALKQPEQAIDSFRRAYELTPEKDELLLEISHLYQGTGQADQAISATLAYLQKHPQDARVQQDLAGLYLDSKQYDLALARLETVLPQLTEPGDRYDARKDMAFARQMQGDSDTAIAEYETLLSEEAAKTDLQLLSNLAIAYHQKKAYEKAANTYKMVYYATPELQTQYRIDKDKVGNDMAIALTALGDAAYQNQDYTPALSWYAEATMSADKANYWPTLGMANAYYAMQNREKAAEAYQKVLEIDPRQVTARLYQTKLAMTAKEKGPNEPMANRATLEGLARENPGNVDVLLSLAEVYAERGDRSGALSTYEKALALQPDNVELLLSVGSQWQQMGQFAQAKKAYERAVAINPNLPVLHYNLGIVHNELGELEASADSYRKALALDPNFSDSRYGLAVTYEKQQKFQDALDSYQTYLQDPAAKYQPEATQRIELLRQTLNPPAPQPGSTLSAPGGIPTNQGAIQPILRPATQ